MDQNIKADKRLGERIRAARKARGMTQEQLAAKLQLHDCDISRGTLAKIEAGIRHISVAEITALTNILQISYDELFRKP